MGKKRSLYILLYCSLLFGLVLGAGINEALFVMPAWFQAPPTSLLLIGERAGSAMAFWLPLQAALLGTLVASLVLNWRSPVRRKLLAGALGAYVLVWVLSGAIFAPEINALAAAGAQGPYDGELAARGQRWLQLSWSRHVVLALGWVLVGGAISKWEAAS
ncbi:DUF1772 domain-containing protein [Myxococcus sp. CA056]|uniref:DUF1772 domain-containing protein n=1 Tax=unclassified Myxococcus TaxID=2648731 RepID=UPI00157B6A0C|nr:MULTISPECIES: DUF1772 domain-containing protein [unclassified Myxococcus]NTX13592.1 DUF1772 domain-containing protein [Myxococcus sp. CA056]NTX38888.1 DUF1772 domain-containing protein [Myxococcus sp. CA033]NTX53839.1 DUF1772 domain-containing protein [Myxococcus sp. CA039A]